MTNLRRHASRRNSALARKASNGIGLLRIHGLFGERKSGTPLSVEMPAPVKPATHAASATRACKSLTSVAGSSAGSRMVMPLHIGVARPEAKVDMREPE